MAKKLIYANGMRSEKYPEIEFNYEAVIIAIWLRKFNHRAFPAPASRQSISKVVMVISARLNMKRRLMMKRT